MDAYQQQQHSRYMRPPQPPPPPDPHHSYLHHQHPRPPVPPQATWYSNQFQFHPQPPSSHSPPPHQWPAPPLPSSSYPAHPPPPPPMHPYPSHHQFAPPLPPPQVPAHSHLPQSYPQEWGNPNWGQHQHQHQHQHQPQQQQGWDYQATNNTEDWGARARAWAAQKAATAEDQYLQSQISQVGPTEEQNQFHEQYPQSSDSHYQDFPQQQYSAPGYHQFPVSAAAPSHQATIYYLQDNASFSSGPSNVSDGRMPYAVGNGVSAGAPTTSPSVLQQEVPSSYSSVAAKEEAIDKKEELYESLPLPSTHEGQHRMQPSVPAFGGSVLTEQPFAYGSQGADLTADLSNQPLDFTPRFTCDQDPHMQSNYAAHHDSLGSTRGLAPVTPLPSTSSWTPAAATGAAYPSVPPGLQSGHQIFQNEPSVAMPSPVSGHNAPPFGSFPAPSFQPTISASSMSYSLGPGSSLNPTTGFQGDAYGVSNITERPKKASVPNWLKEEIIKNASVITRSSFEHAKEETQSVEDEGVDRSFEKSGQADSKSIDSARSTEEEDEDEEDDEDVARAAAINQEIKRVLTEILLKVTDDLFDEIATKVLDEDDPTVEVDHKADSGNRKVSSSSPEAPTPKASAKVLVPAKAKEPEGEDASEKSSSSAPGNVLGLANYASDDDEDDEIRSSSLSNFRKNEVLQQSNISKFSKDTNHVVENGSPPRECRKDTKMTSPETDMSKTSSAESKNQINAAFSDLSEHKYSSQLPLRARDIENSTDGRTTVPTNNKSGSEVAVALEQNAADDSLDKANRMKSDENNRHESKRNNSGKDIMDAELRSREDEKADGIHRKHDEIHLTKEKKDDRSGLRERMKEQSDGTGERVNEFSSKKSSHLDAKDVKRELEKRHRSRGKEDAKRKRSQTKDREEDRARRNTDSGRHKRRRSSSTSSKGRNSKDKDDSSDEASDDMKRKKHSRKRNLSPSPVRSRRRQVSRSPHSKHSQRRHSPYSSLETTRKKRSRSRSPVRRHR